MANIKDTKKEALAILQESSCKKEGQGTELSVVVENTLPDSDKISQVISFVARINFPITNSMIKPIPTLPTSPAKHFAFPFGRKLNQLNTSTPIIATTRNDSSIKPPILFTNPNGTSTVSVESLLNISLFPSFSRHVRKAQIDSLYFRHNDSILLRYCISCFS